MDDPPCIYLSAETEELATWLREAVTCFEKQGFQVICRSGPQSAERTRRRMEKSVAWVYAGSGFPPEAPEGEAGILNIEYAEAERLALRVCHLFPIESSAGEVVEADAETEAEMRGEESSAGREPAESGNERDVFEFWAGRKHSFLTAMQYAAAQFSVVFGELLPNASRTLPPAAQHFTGREGDVDWLVKKLRKARAGAHISLIGPGGVGKTAIAREAIERAADSFPGGVFMHDFYAAPVLTAFQDSILGKYMEAMENEAREEIMHNILSSERVLVYAEGVEKLREHPAGVKLPDVYKACGSAVVLITSRDGLDSWLTDTRVIGALPVEEATALLWKHMMGGGGGSVTASPEPACQTLAMLMGCQPLALTLAGTLLSRSGESAEECAATLQAAGMERVEAHLRPVEALRFLFLRLATDLPPAARAAWHALSLHGMGLTRLATVAACLEMPEAAAAEALAALETRGIAITGDLPQQPCTAVESAWRLAHPRMGEWGRSRLLDAGVDQAALQHRWRQHWQEYCREAWRRGIEGSRSWQAFIIAHLRGFADGMARLYPDTEELRATLYRCARLAASNSFNSDALHFAQRAEVLSSSLHGRDSEQALLCRITHALAMEDTTRGHGISLLEDYLHQAAHRFGPAHRTAQRARTALAWLLFARNEPRSDARAVALLEENLAFDPGDCQELKDERLISQSCLTHHYLSKQSAGYAEALIKLVQMDREQSAAGLRLDPGWIENLAAHYWERGDWGAALEHYQRAESAWAEIPFHHQDRFRVRSWIFEVLMKLDRRTDALELAERLGEFADGFGEDAPAFVEEAEAMRKAALTPPE